MPAKTASARVRVVPRDDLIVDFAGIRCQPAEIREGLTLLLDALTRCRACRA